MVSELIAVVEGVERRSFRKGWGKVQHKDAGWVKSEILKGFGVVKNHRQAWHNLLHGITSTSPVERGFIEGIFAKISVKSIWD